MPYTDKYRRDTPQKPSRRQFLLSATAATLGTYLTETFREAGIGKSPNQAIVDSECLEKNALNDQLMQAVEANLPAKAAEILKNVSDSQFSSVSPSFRKALIEGKAAVMEPYLDRFPKLANAIYDVSFDTGNTPLDLVAQTHDKIPVLSILLNKGARFEFMLHPAKLVSAAAAEADVGTLRFLDQKGFTFPKMQGYFYPSYSPEYNSPFRDLIDGARLDVDNTEKLIQTAKFLKQKGYDPLKKIGWFNAAGYGDYQSRQTTDYTNGSNDNRDALERTIGRPHDKSRITREQAQANMTALLDYFKTVERLQSRSQDGIQH